MNPSVYLQTGLQLWQWLPLALAVAAFSSGSGCLQLWQWLPLALAVAAFGSALALAVAAFGSGSGCLALSIQLNPKPVTVRLPPSTPHRTVRPPPYRWPPALSSPRTWTNLQSRRLFLMTPYGLLHPTSRWM